VPFTPGGSVNMHGHREVGQPSATSEAQLADDFDDLEPPPQVAIRQMAAGRSSHSQQNASDYRRVCLPGQ
jgi:hypothetical protein